MSIAWVQRSPEPAEPQPELGRDDRPLARPPSSIVTIAVTLSRLPAGELPAEVGVDEAVEVAVEHGAGVADLVAGPQVLDELVGLEDVGADLAAEADLALLVVLLGEVGLALLFLAGGSAWP